MSINKKPSATDLSKKQHDEVMAALNTHFQDVLTHGKSGGENGNKGRYAV
jgi:hypothetical protein